MSVHFDPSRNGSSSAGARTDDSAPAVRLGGRRDGVRRRSRGRSAPAGIGCPTPSPRPSGDGIYAYETNAGGPLSIRVPSVGRDAVVATRFHKPPGCGDRAPATRRVDRARRDHRLPGDFADLLGAVRRGQAALSHAGLPHRSRDAWPQAAAAVLRHLTSSRASTRSGSATGSPTMVELVEAGELAPKTVNNARTYLSMRSTRPCAAGFSPATRATACRRSLSSEPRSSSSDLTRSIPTSTHAPTTIGRSQSS